MKITRVQLKRIILETLGDQDEEALSPDEAKLVEFLKQLEKDEDLLMSLSTLSEDQEKSKGDIIKKLYTDYVDEDSADEKLTDDYYTQFESDV